MPFLEIDGTNIYYETSAQFANSDQLTIVFLHDALGSVAQWKSFPARLAETIGLNYLVFDRQGHGRSDGFNAMRKADYMHHQAFEVLPKVLEQLQVSGPIIVGHSDGGTIALLYASRYQPRMVISLAAHAYVEECTREGIRSAMQIRPLLLEKLKKYHGDKTEALFDAWSLTWLADFFADWNILDELKSVQCPCLLIQGTADEYATPKHLEDIDNRISGDSFSILLNDVGHFPHKEQTAQIITAIDKFVAKNR